MEPVAATSTPDPAPVRISKRPGWPGLSGALVWLLVPHVWIGVIVLAIGLFQGMFPFISETVPAHVVDKLQGTAKGRATYTVRYGFDFHGTSASTDASVDKDAFAAVHEGDVVDVRAARALGSVYGRAPSETNFPIILFFAAGWNALLFLVLRQTTWRPLLRWSLMRRGRRTRGVVGEVIVGTGRGAVVVVHYTFTRADGVEERARMAVPVAEFHKGPVASGDSVDVVYAGRFAAIEALTSWERT